MYVSIIIVNYNTKQLLINCLTSIKENIKDIEYEVIVVDNDSKDGSQEMLKHMFPWVHLIENNANVGFGKANNIGATYASGKYLFLLNSDTILLNDSLYYFLNYKENVDPEDSKIGVLGCYLQDKNGKLNDIGGNLIKWYTPIIKIWNILSTGLKSKSNIDVYNITNVEYVIGADMFISKKLYNIVDGFDENFFMYCEEADMQKRIIELGYKNIIIPAPKIIHLEGGSTEHTKGLTLKRYSMLQKSRHYYIHKHFNFYQIFLWKLFNIPFSILQIIKQKWSLEDKISAFKLSLKG